MGTCKACGGTGMRELPIAPDDIDEFPCPVCKPWPHGFPGEAAFGRWVTSRSEPGQPAVYYGSDGPLLRQP